MDLETIGKKMLEVLALRGQLSGMEGELETVRERIYVADEAIKVAKLEKGNASSARKRTEIALKDAEAGVVGAETELKTAQDNLEKAIVLKESKEIDVDKYNDGVLSGLDGVIADKDSIKRDIETEYAIKAKKITEAKADVESRKAELRTEGVELDVGGVRTPKVTYL